MIRNIGIYYGSSGGATKDVAEQLAQALQATGLPITLQDIAGADLSQMAGHDLLLLGCSTWNWGDLQDDWEAHFAAFSELDLQGVRVGLFGCGDQYGYPDTFGDALGIIGEAAAVSGATLVGRLPFSGYEFNDSRAVQGGELLGLLIDDDNEREKTPQRLAQWVGVLQRELSLGMAQQTA